MRIWTIGHSTRPVDEFITLLEANDIKLLADVRAWPGSKRYPRNASFRGYADYMETTQFQSGIERARSRREQHRAASVHPGRTDS
jgi:uncharacterized protein (DUF488 family)